MKIYKLKIKGRYIYCFLKGATAYELQIKRLGIRYCHLKADYYGHWFRNKRMFEPMAIIHFTEFKY